MTVRGELLVEWGNFTICGDAYIGFDGVTNAGGFPGNTLPPCRSNEANMEGFEEAGNPTLNNYGGGDDNYDAGSISYLSYQYRPCRGCPMN